MKGVRRTLTRGLVTATIVTGVLLAPALTGVSQAAQSGRGGGAMPPSGALGPVRGALAPPAMPLRVTPVMPDTSRATMPSAGAAARPVSPVTPRPVPWVLTPNVAAAPMSRDGVRPTAPPPVDRAAPQPRTPQAQPGATAAPRTLREPSATTARPPAQAGPAVTPRTLREPSATTARPPAQVGPAVTPRAVREPSPIPAPPRQLSQAGPTVTPSTPREPSVTQVPSRVMPAQPALRPSAPGRTERTTTPQALQSWVRTQNAGARTLRSDRDALGNQIPRDAVSVSPDRLTRMNRDFGAIRDRFGDPAHRFAFVPRTGFDRDFFGIRDGRDGFHRFRHHSIVVIDFFYPFYFSDPFWFGFDYPGYYPSIYSFWGWCPPWVYPDRIVYSPPTGVYGTANPYYLYGGSSVDSAGAERAVNDIRQAWITGEVQLLAMHVTDQQEVGVYFNGQYTYSTSSQDYYGMTVDAISTTQTVSLDFDDPVWVSQSEVFYTGRHVFTDPDGNQKTVYVSYMLKKIGSDWYIESVGSSPQPIQSQYQDFRSY